MNTASTFHYSRWVLARQMAVYSLGSLLLFYFVFISPTERLMGSQLLAQYGLPAGLVSGVIMAIVTLVEILSPPISIRLTANGVELFCPPRTRRFDWSEIRGADLIERLPLEPYGLHLVFAGGERRVRFLSRADRDRLVGELADRGISVREAAVAR